MTFKYYHLCKRGIAGTHNLNIILQEALNPSNITIKYGGTVYRLNDKVMQIKTIMTKRL